MIEKWPIFKFLSWNLKEYPGHIDNYGKFLYIQNLNSNPKTPHT